MTGSEEEVPSPCNDQCEVDDDGICIACFRSFVEITKWPKVDNKTRLEYLKNVEKRRIEYANK